MSCDARAASLTEERHPAFDGLIGVSRADITPDIGIYSRNWGASHHDTSVGVHRPLNITALTLQTDAESAPLVIVDLDLGWWRSYKDEWYVRGFVLHELSLESSHLMICLTHTHAGPVLCSQDADKPGGDLIAGYLDRLRTTIVRSIRLSLAAAQRAVLEWRYGTCGLAANRDLPDPGSARVLCGFNPSLKADQTLLVGRVTNAHGQILATIVNYACHPTTLAWENRLISPDFVGSMRAAVEAECESAPCLFLQGASGELAPRRQYTADTEWAEANGRELGYAALSVLSGMNAASCSLEFTGSQESGASLAVWKYHGREISRKLSAVQLNVDLPLQQMPGLAAIDESIRTVKDRVELERLVRKRRIREAVGDERSTQMAAWVWRVGDCFLVGHPNEAYSLLQSALRSGFPKNAVAVMNVVNGHFGYLPPENLYQLDIYPVWQSPFGPGSLERLISACLSQLQGM